MRANGTLRANQGGGDPHTQHRCPGEWITIAVMKRGVQALVRDMRYDVPEQDLTIDKADMPALPESGFVIRNLRGHSNLSPALSRP